MPKIYSKQIIIDAASIDIHNHVNNQEYLKWMQEVAIEHSALQGWPMERYLENQASWYVKSHFIEYVRPAMLGDNIAAYTWVFTLERRTSKRATLFVREKDRQVLARAQTDWIFVSLKSGRSLAIPQEVGSAFELVNEAEALHEIGL